jgi:predicted P-loop ATPase
VSSPELARAAAAFYKDPDWRQQLLVTSRGKYKANLANALVAFRNDLQWAGVLAFNVFAGKIETQLVTPWGKPAGEQWNDNDDRLATDWLQHQGIDVPTTIAGAAVLTVAIERSFHPVRDYLRLLNWDGVHRLDTWVHRYLGVDPNEDIAGVFGRCWMISAVARALQPGCKADCALILEGEQGLLKSTALRALSKGWFTDQISDLGTKDAAMQSHGVWIVELAELDSISRTDVSRIKAFMSATFDRFRLPYGKNVVEWPRDCVFAGSTNQDAYLRDETGGRRFWPIRCGKIDLEGLRRDCDQLWAEAVVRYAEKVPWWLTSADDVKAAEEQQQARYEGDAWEEKLAQFTETRTDLSIAEFMGFIGKPEGQWTKADECRVGRILKSWKWKKYRGRIGSARPWRYRQ